MSFDVSTAFVQQYKTNVEMLLQQRGSKLRNAVMSDSYTGKAGKAVEQIGPVTAQKRTTRHADTPLISTPHDARWVYPTDYEWADLVDDQDKLKMLVDPSSAYAINGAMALGRAIDDEIITAAFGDAKTGEEVWRARLDGNYSASPVYAGGKIYFLNETGQTTVIQPGREFEKLAVSQLDGRTLASMAIVDGTVFLRTDSHLYRIESTDQP